MCSGQRALQSQRAAGVGQRIAGDVEGEAGERRVGDDDLVADGEVGDRVAVEAGRRPLEEVVAGSAYEQIRARAASNRIVSVPALEHIGVAIAGQRVGEGRAGQVLDVGERVPPAAAGILRIGHQQADHDPRLRVEIGCRVDARAAVQHIAALAARHLVGTSAASDRVIAVAAPDQTGLSAGVAVERVVRSAEVDETVDQTVVDDIFPDVAEKHIAVQFAVVEDGIGRSGRNRHKLKSERNVGDDNAVVGEAACPVRVGIERFDADRTLRIRAKRSRLNVAIVHLRIRMHKQLYAGSAHRSASDDTAVIVEEANRSHPDGGTVARYRR